MANTIEPLVAEVEAKLRAHAAWFTVTTERRPPAGEERVAAVERALGAALPEPLRAFYRDVAAFAHTSWTLRDETAQELDVPEPDRGQIEVVPLESLLREQRSGRSFVRFVNDGHGDGFALDLDHAKKGKVPVVWVCHDEEPAFGDRHASIDAMMKAWAKTGFAHPDVEASLSALLAAGKKAARKPRAVRKPEVLGASAAFGALGAAARELPTHRDAITSVAVFPDGERAVVVSKDGAVDVVTLAGRVRATATALTGAWTVAIDPSGGQFAIGGGSAIQVFSSEGKVLRKLPMHNVYDLAYHPGGRILVACGGYATTDAFDLETGARLWSVPTDATTVHCLDDGRVVTLGAAFKQTPKFHVLDAETGRVARAIEAPALPQPKTRGFVVDGDRVRVPVAEPACIATWELSTGTPVTLPSAGTTRAPVVRAGDRLFVGRLDVAQPTLDAWDLATAALTARLVLGDLGPHPAGFTALAVTPDGRTLVCGSNVGWAMTVQTEALPKVG